MPEKLHLCGEIKKDKYENFQTFIDDPISPAYQRFATGTGNYQ
jgi:hypothetical protein